MTAGNTKPGRIHIGTSGWHYPHWRQTFYPADLTTSRWLEWYSRHFDCVELNNSFYRLPSRRAVAQWVRQTPQAFLFAVKASRLLTHMKKLRQCENPLTVFLEIIAGFGNKLGPVLFQLPPRWRVDLTRLEPFLKILPPCYRYAFEFRDPSWHCEPVYRLLRRHRVAICQYHLSGFLCPECITTDFIYLRLHGPAEAYAGSYSAAELQFWAGRLMQWQDQGKTAYLFFDNDQQGFAPANALQLQKLCTAKRPDGAHGLAHP